MVDVSFVPSTQRIILKIDGFLVDDYYGIVVEGEKSFQKKILPLFGKYEVGKLF